MRINGSATTPSEWSRFQSILKDRLNKGEGAHFKTIYSSNVDIPFMYFAAKAVILAEALSSERAIRYHFEILLRKLGPRLAPVVIVFSLQMSYNCLFYPSSAVNIG